MQQQLPPPPRLVENRAGGGMTMPSRDADGRTDDGEAPPDKAATDAQRIPRLFPSTSAFPAAQQPHQQQQLPPSRLQPQRPHHASVAFPHRSAADIMLGLKTLATHADRQAPILTHDGNPMPTFPTLRLSPSLPSSFARRVPPSMALPAARFPSVAAAPTPFGRDQQQRGHSDGATRSPVRFGELLGRKNKRGEARLPDTVLSPTARSQGYTSDREITLSPPSAVAPAPRLLPVATTIAWRSASSAIFSPSAKRFRPTSPALFEHEEGDKAHVTLAALEPQRSTLPISMLTRSVSSPAGPAGPAGPMSTMLQPPVLVRKSSAKWRSGLAELDRRKSRERIQRALQKHADGDYETLLLLVASMEEELLHVKTTAREHYHTQAQALSNEIQHAALEQ